MKPAPKIINERERLEALLSYEILDTEPEAALDKFTSLASIICASPIALISLVDSERQWFKSKLGIDAAETPREISFCGHAIAEKNIFIVPDSLEDDRFRDNPAVTGDPHVRFYAGAPLVTPSGHSIGTLCVVGYEPKTLDAEQIRALEFLAAQIITHFELRKSLKKSQEDFKELQRLTRVIASQDERLHKMDKFVSLARMANGMAHEINNPLAIITGTVQVLRGKAKGSLSEEDLVTDLSSIEKMTARIGRITQALGQLSKSDEVGKKISRFSVKELFDQTLLFYDEKLRNSGIRLTRATAEDQVLEADIVKLSKVVYNLLDNAFHAVVDLQEKWIALEVRIDGQIVRISVIDSGTGINPDIAGRIMEPFFTTRVVGQGTGLGLSVSKGLIESCGGELILETDSPNTKFTICVPVRPNP